jgi:hypothetical protein
LILFIDGSSFAFVYLNIENHDPPIEELIDTNPGEKNGECQLEKY